MAIRGAQAKKDITKKILEIFPGSFTYEKEIRIPYVDSDNTTGQIKVVLTAAKVAVEGGDDTILPGEKATATADTKPAGTNEKVPQEPTAEEKERLSTLLNMLGL